MSARTLVRLADRYPGTSRMTRYRWRRNEPDFPDPIIIAGREFYDSAELSQWEERRRRRKASQQAAPNNNTTA